MCLLEEVLEWDENAIACRAVSHRDPANPLRSGVRQATVNPFSGNLSRMPGSVQIPFRPLPRHSGQSAPRAGLRLYSATNRNPIVRFIFFDLTPDWDSGSQKSVTPHCIITRFSIDKAQERLGNCPICSAATCRRYGPGARNKAATSRRTPKSCETSCVQGALPWFWLSCIAPL